MRKYITSLIALLSAAVTAAFFMLMTKVKRLEGEVKLHETQETVRKVKEDSDEIRDRPVPDSKHDILDRM